MGDEDTRWWDRFDAVIRNWLHSDPESVEAWDAFEATDRFRPLQDLAKRGQVSDTDPARTAAWEAFLYQRSHIEAVKAVVRQSVRPAAIPTEGGQLGVVDVGCGAGTVAFALDELLGGRVAVRYLGLDHHGPSVDFCTRMCSDWLQSEGGSFHAGALDWDKVVSTVSDWGHIDWLMITCSYLLGQNTATTDVIEDIASGVQQLSTASGTVRLVIADAPRPECKAADLIAATKALGVHVDDLLGSVYDYTMRFPHFRDRRYRTSRSSRVQGHYIVVG